MSKYLVEDFVIEDAQHGEANQMACDAEAAELIEMLGLRGQQALQNPETLTRCPYPMGEEEQLAVYRALNPETCKPEDYSFDAIPVRVMQILAHAKSLDFFTDFQIWYPKMKRVEDPVLVGIRTWRRPGRDWDATDTYLLARWGKALLPFDELKRTAISTLREATAAKIEEGLAELNRAADRVKTTADIKWLSGHFYISTP
jgi:hypothetical protein